MPVEIETYEPEPVPEASLSRTPPGGPITGTGFVGDGDSGDGNRRGYGSGASGLPSRFRRAHDNGDRNRMLFYVFGAAALTATLVWAIGDSELDRRDLSNNNRPVPVINNP